MSLRWLLGPLACLLLFGGCSSPAEDMAECKTECDRRLAAMDKARALIRTGAVPDKASSKSEPMNLCWRRCSREVYGEFDSDKLLSLCKEGDGTACLKRADRAAALKNGDTLVESLAIGCEGKQAIACGILGKTYQAGKLVPKDDEKGNKYVTKACELGDVMSCAAAGFAFYKKDEFGKAKTYFEKGCTGDAKAACSMLGVVYRDAKGVPRDNEKALTHFTKSCSLGYKPACNAKRRVSRRARKQKECKAGDVRACSIYGSMLYFAKQYKDARPLLEKACAQSNGAGCGMLAKLYRFGRGVEVDTDKADEYAQKACGFGYRSACKRTARRTRRYRRRSRRYRTRRRSRRRRGRRVPLSSMFK